MDDGREIGRKVGAAPAASLRAWLQGFVPAADDATATARRLH